MTLTTMIARCIVAIVGVAAFAAFATEPANHYILPCPETCPAPRWTTTGSLNHARWMHTATLLDDGSVLVVGGSGPATGAERYDPVAKTWRLTGPMSFARWGHTATLLADGRVLVVGGDQQAPATAEIYDPAADTWSRTGSPVTVRGGHTAVLLHDGTVLIAGGYTVYVAKNGGLVDSAEARTEIFDPDTESWHTSGSLSIPRHSASMTVLESGHVLLATGTDVGDMGWTLRSAELYDPESGDWSLVDDARGGGVWTALIDLPGGKVLMVGGNGGGGGGQIIYKTAETYDLDTRSWSRIGDLLIPRYGHTATLLDDGAVLVAGGNLFVGRYPQLPHEWPNATERLDPRSLTWSSAASLNHARIFHTATLLRDGSVLVAGGRDVRLNDYQTIPLASAEIYAASVQPQRGREPGDDKRRLGSARP